MDFANNLKICEFMSNCFTDVNDCLLIFGDIKPNFNRNARKGFELILMTNIINSFVNLFIWYYFEFQINSQKYEDLGFGDYNNFIENYAKYSDKEYETCGRPYLSTSLNEFHKFYDFNTFLEKFRLIKLQ